jgi:Tfp pilus assembly protein PilP
MTIRQSKLSHGAATPRAALRSRRFLGGCAAVAGALLLAGCAPDTSDLDKYIVEVKARRSTAIEPIPEMKAFESFVYPDDLERDPFSAPELVAVQPSSGPRPDSTRPRELLEEFPLDSLRMMGTLHQKTNLWALIKDPQGTIHRVQIGNYLGQNHGRVTYIDEQQVKVSELIPDGSGGWIQREAALAVKE